VTLETPAMNFIKAVRVEGSADGQNWQRLAQGQPIFRQLYGAGQLHVSFPAGEWRWLRLTIDDQRSQPVPFTGARVHAADVEATPIELQTVAIAERNENPGETRLTLNLGAANLDVASVKIETDEPLFTRAVTLAVPQIAEDSIREQTVGQGVIYRVAIEGQPPSASLSVPLETQIRSRELVLLIRNEDSPPLPVTAVRVERRPVYLVFMARQAGTLHLLTGNKSCAAPRYDLAALGADLKNAAVTPLKISALADNPNYRAPEALAGLEVTGAALDVSAWKFRKPDPAVARRRAANRTGPRRAGARGCGLCRPARAARQQPGALHRPAHVHQPRAHADGHGDERREESEVEPLDHQTAQVQSAAHAPDVRDNNAAVPALDVAFRGTHRRARQHLLPPVAGQRTWTQTPERKTKEFSLPLDSAARRATR
jgi:hypothetical protein